MRYRLLISFIFFALSAGLKQTVSGQYYGDPVWAVQVAMSRAMAAQGARYRLALCPAFVVPLDTP